MSGSRTGRSLAAEVLDALADAGQGLTLGQLQRYLPGYHELPTLSATLVKLERAGRVSVAWVPRTAERGRRMVKQYRRAAAPAP